MNKTATIKISTDEFRYIGFFESLTGAAVKDCAIYPDHVLFVVKQGDMGLAIGKGGMNVKKVEDSLGKKVDLIEYSDDPVQFVKGVLAQLKPKNIYLSQKSTGKKVVNVVLGDAKQLNSKAKKLITEAKEYLARYHPSVDDVEVK